MKKIIIVTLAMVMLCCFSTAFGASNVTELSEPFSFMGITFGKTLDEQKLPRDCFMGGSENPSHNIKRNSLPNIGIGAMWGKVQLIDRKIEKLEIEFCNVVADKFSEMMTEKYGDPKWKTKGIMQNRMGAKFPYFIIIWKVKDCTIMLQSIVDKIDEGVITVRTEKFIDQEVRKHLEEQRKNKSNL